MPEMSIYPIHPVRFAALLPVDTQPLEKLIKQHLGEDRYTHLKLRLFVMGDTVKLVSGHIGSTKRRVPSEIIDELSLAWRDVADIKDDSGKTIGEQLQQDLATITVKGVTYKLRHPLP